MQNENRILKIGLIGYGFIGKNHAPNIINHPKSKLHAVFSVPEDKDKIPEGSKFFDEWKNLIDDPEIDAVLIATPTFTHKDIASYAAEKQKHVFLEKPMARNVAECDEIIAACDNANVKLFIGHVLRFWPSYSQAKASIEDENAPIGALKYVRLRRLSGYPGWAKWFSDQKMSGGVMLDLSIHDLDYSTFILGEYPETVYCEAQKMERDGNSVYGLSFTTLKFPSGAIGYCEASWMGKDKFPFTVDAELIGTEGIIQFSGENGIPIKAYTQSEEIIADPYVNDGYYQEWDAFIVSIINDETPLVGGKEGKMAVAMANAAEQSADRNQPISLKEVL